MNKKIIPVFLGLILVGGEASATLLGRVGKVFQNVVARSNTPAKSVTRSYTEDFSADSPLAGKQVFAVPTYDRIAKHILSGPETVRLSILNALTGIKIEEATQLDEHYNPFDPFSQLRKILHAHSSQSGMKEIRESQQLQVLLNGQENSDASLFLKDFSGLYEDILSAFPSSRYRSTVDFLCQTKIGYVTIEVQVAKQNYWDKRALAYAAHIYGKQLREGAKSQTLQNVVAVNLLGDGSTPYWEDGHFIRDYVMTNQKKRTPLKTQTLPYLRLIQYSLGDAHYEHPDLEKNIPLREWIEFFKSAHQKIEMPKNLSQPVQEAYDMIRVDTLKRDEPELLKASQEFFENLTEHDLAVARKGKTAMVKEMLKEHIPPSTIAKVSHFSLEEIENIKADRS